MEKKETRHLTAAVTGAVCDEKYLQLLARVDSILSGPGDATKRTAMKAALHRYAVDSAKNLLSVEVTIAANKRADVEYDSPPGTNWSLAIKVISQGAEWYFNSFNAGGHDQEDWVSLLDETDTGRIAFHNGDGTAELEVKEGTCTFWSFLTSRHDDVETRCRFPQHSLTKPLRKALESAAERGYPFGNLRS